MDSRGLTHGARGMDSRGLTHGARGMNSRGLTHGARGMDSRGLTHGARGMNSRGLTHGVRGMDSRGLTHGARGMNSRGLTHGARGMDSRGLTHGATGEGCGCRRVQGIGNSGSVDRLYLDASDRTFGDLSPLQLQAHASVKHHEPRYRVTVQLHWSIRTFQPGVGTDPGNFACRSDTSL